MTNRKVLLSAAAALLLVTPAFAEERSSSSDQKEGYSRSANEERMGDQGQTSGSSMRRDSSDRQDSSGSSAQRSQDYTRGRMGGQQQLSREQITEIQRKLNSEADANLEIDGVMGSKTRQALRKFQQEENLQVTGSPNSETLKELGVDSEQ